MSGEDLRALAEEQAALRRVATLVARGVAPEEVFAAVTQEVGRLLAADYAGLGRYEPDDTITIVSVWSRAGGRPFRAALGSLGGKNVSTIVFETGRSAADRQLCRCLWGRSVSPPASAGIGSAVGTPIIVEGRLWGVMAVGSTRTSRCRRTPRRA